MNQHAVLRQVVLCCLLAGVLLGSAAAAMADLCPTPTINTTFEGFGATTPGGNAYVLSPYTVTSLAASGPGTLAEAVSQGNRYIVFDVAGTINLSGPILVRGANLTIDGCSAPSPGITLQGGGLYLQGDQGAHDLIVRNLRVRGAYDGFRVAFGAYNIVLDQVSSQGASDGNIDITEDSHDITVSWGIFADPVSKTNSLLGYRALRLTMHHNLFIQSVDRNPNAGYDYTGLKPPAGETTLDFWNNLVWNWGGGRGTLIHYGSQANVVDNYFHAPGGDNGDALVVCSTAVPVAHEGDCNFYEPVRFAQAYVAGNVNPDLLNVNAVGAGAVSTPFPGILTGQYGLDILPPDDACTAATSVHTGAGALPVDSVDQSYLSTVSLSTCGSGGNTHDVAVSAVSAPTAVEQGNTVTVFVTVANQGSVSETFAVSLTDTPPAGGTAGAVTNSPQTVSVAAGSTTTLSFTWATDTASTGDHTLTAEASQVTGETDTADNTLAITVTVNTPGTSPTIGASSVSVTLAKKGPSWEGKATVKVVDGTGTPVREAKVTGDWSLNGVIFKSGISGTTNGKGQVQLSSGQIQAKSGDVFTFTVTNVSKAGYTWDGVQQSSSATVP